MSDTERLVEERGSNYGHPAINHTRCAGLWDAYLENLDGRPLGPEDVCYMMILLKIARAQHGVRMTDTVEDIKGYAENIVMIWEASPE